MAIRVLATIPELPAAAESVTSEPVYPVEAAAPLPHPALLPRPSPQPAPRRGRARGSFPGVSVAALAVVAAAIWSLVAVREARRPGSEAQTTRLAAEPIDAGATETTRR